MIPEQMHPIGPFFRLGHSGLPLDSRPADVRGHFIQNMQRSHNQSHGFNQFGTFDMDASDDIIDGNGSKIKHVINIDRNPHQNLRSYQKHGGNISTELS